MLHVLVVLLPLTLLACSPDRPATTAFLKVDPSADPQQTQDRPSTQWNPLKATAPKAGTSSSAWLEPSPASFSFSADDSAWKTFTVRTSSDVDSVLVVVNPTGKDRALEVAGGNRPPSRNYCPAEGNDSPTRARRNGWSLHLSACAVGETEIVLFDHEQTELARYAIQVAEAKAEAEAEAGTGSSAWLEPSPDSFSFTADDSAWKTFTVRTSSDVDSVLVVVNPTGKDKALEVAGGNRPPSRDYCPAEGNDSPTRARRNGWPLYLSVCEAGDTEIVLFDYEQTELARYDVRVQEPSEESPRFNIELVFLDEFPAFEEEVIKRAANYWEERLGDIPEFVFDEPHETGCYASEHRVQYEREDSIDDLTIFIAFLPRDDIATGRGGGLIYRDSGLPAVGCVTMKPRIWDENYHPFLGGPLHEFWVYNTTVHEIGHVLGIGIGPNWYAIETIENNQLHFPGPNAIEKFNQLPRFVRHDPTSPKGLFDYHTKAIVEQPGGTLYTGHKVPLTSDGGHWGEPLGGELMADAPGHWVDSFPKLSTVTLGALADMGYPVHYELAFPFWVDLNPPRGKPVVSALLEKQFLCGVGLDP